jgi:hypothetical protein
MISRGCTMSGTRLLGGGLLVLAAGLAVNAVLGPLWLNVIDYRYGHSMTSQGIGLDAVVLLLVVPMGVVGGWLTFRGRPAGPVLALGPTAFAAYMLPQYVIGPEYDRLPGNNERFVGFHLGLFVLAVGLLLACWRATGGLRLGPDSGRSDRRRSWVMVGLAAFILLRWVPALAALTSGRTSDAGYQDNPTAFLLVGLLDVGLVVPAALVTAAGLRRGAGWARRAAYGLIGWFALVPVSVAAMAVVMQVRGDPEASAADTTVFTVAAAVFLVAAGALYRPVLRTAKAPAPVSTEREAFVEA